MTKKIMIARCTILFLGITVLLFGIARGEAGIVLQKAINICLECIGIG